MKAKRPDLVTTTVSTRYQTVIPAEVRERFMIREGSKIAWVVSGDRIEVVPLPDKPWQQFRGAGRGWDLLQRLAAHRTEERARDHQAAEQDSRADDGHHRGRPGDR